MNELTLAPIGILHCRGKAKFEAPHQPDPEHSPSATIELEAGQNFEIALRNLEGFSKIWLIWWFHRNEKWRPTTRPPRGRSGRKGIFSTRSPYRPNPIAMSAVDLLSVQGRTLTIGHHDLVDGTPILDIKPYIPTIDSFPKESIGWLQEVEDSEASEPAFHLDSTTSAREGLAWIEAREPGLSKRIENILRQDPYPHKTRRITKYQGGYRMSCGDWRVFYGIEDQQVKVHRLSSRYRALASDIPLVHQEFLNTFGLPE